MDYIFLSLFAIAGLVFIYEFMYAEPKRLKAEIEYREKIKKDAAKRGVIRDWYLII